MRKNAWLFVTIAVLCSALSFALEPRQSTDNPYAALCGEYLFDMTAYGGNQLTVRVFLDNGRLMIQGDPSEPADHCVPVEGNPAKFSIEDPDEGHWDAEFLKNAEGKVARLHLVNQDLGFDITGDKVEK